MDHFFEKCNSCTYFNGVSYVDGDGYDVFEKQEKYILSGLVPNYHLDLYVRNGFGALCFCCGMYSTLESVMKEAMEFNNFYDFPGKISEGYKFVIGPGVSDGSFAVYCSNYLEFIKSKSIK